LSASEQERLQAITAPRRRAQFIAGRLLLRRLLQPLQSAEAFSISASDQGPPRLEYPGAGAPPLHLALSHSGDWVCAAAAPVPVGLDLETTQGRSRSRDWLGLAEMAGSPAERATLVALTTPCEQGRFFLRLWTLKEAWFKQQARALDAALLPRLHTAPATDEASLNAWVWQTENCSLALTWSSAISCAPLPVHWIHVHPPGQANDPAPMDTPQAAMVLPPLAQRPPQPWQVGLITPA
jgi:4'-phosphopantetheinyl transferase